MVEEVERRLSHVREPVRIAVMGCSVNGPGEAREADVQNIQIAIAGKLSEAPMRFAAIRMEIRGEYADRIEMEKLVTIARSRGIPVCIYRPGRI